MDGVRDAAMVMLVEINKTEFLNEQLEKEERLGKEQLEWEENLQIKQLKKEEKVQIEQLEKEEKLHLEKIKQEQRQCDRDVAFKWLDMEQQIVRTKAFTRSKIGIWTVKLERTNIEAKKFMRLKFKHKQ